MPKKIPIILLFSVVIAACSLFAAAEAIAEERPLECVAGGKYTMTPSPDYDFPYYQSGEPGECDCGDGIAGWAWRYRVTAPNPKFLSKINKGHFFIPSSPPNIIEVWDAAERGVGGTSGWGDLNYNGIVVTVEQISGATSYVEYLFCTKDVNTYGVISPVLDTGTEGELGCVASTPPDPDVQGPVGGIIGPGLDLPGFIPAQLDQTIQLGTMGEVCAKRHPTTGCIMWFYDCKTGVKIDPEPSPPDWIAGVLEDCGDLSGMNRHCRECIFLHHGSPGCYWAYANGVYTCLACW